MLVSWTAHTRAAMTHYYDQSAAAFQQVRAGIFGDTDAVVRTALHLETHYQQQ